MHKMCVLSAASPSNSGSSMASAMSRKRLRKKKDMLIMPGNLTNNGEFSWDVLEISQVLRLLMRWYVD